MKKVLSIFLTLAMLISLIPAVFAADTEVNVVYDFQGKFLDGKNYADLTYATCENWAHVANSQNDKTIGVKDGGVRSNSSGNIRVNGSTTTGDYWIAFKLKIDTATDYSMQIKVSAPNAACTSARIDAYIFKTDTGSGVAEGMTEPNKLSASGLSEAGVAKELTLGTPEQLPTGKKRFEKGDYYFVFRPVSIDGQNVNWVTLYSLTLNGTVTEPEEDKPLTDAFKPESSATAENYSEPVVITVSKDGMDDITSVKNADGTHNITAPETNKNGAKFLYWAKGLTAQKRILIGKTNVLENYAPDSEYANYLIPVYADEVSGTEYYNANGQLIPEATQNTTVSMAGYGTSNGWDKYCDTNIYVAHYELTKPEANIDVTVINGAGTDTYAFGDTVTCRATGTGTFKCWTKSGINGEIEIVSCDSVYTFKAWEECTVTAVYEDHYYTGSKMKIIIDNFTVGNETGVMAEFIGFDDAVEKGIMFTDSDKNTTKIAMTTKDNQFTVIADGNGVYNGYAIIKEEDGSYTIITDGSYEHTK